MHTHPMDWRHRRGHPVTRLLAGPPPVSVDGLGIPVTQGRDVDADRPNDVRAWHDACGSEFAFAALSCPASQLVDPTIAAWARRRKVCIDVGSIAELDATLDRGITPIRIVVHGSETAAAPLRRGCQLGVGRYVIGSAGQAAVLAAAAGRRPSVIIDVTEDDGIVPAVLGAARLEAVGVRMRLTGTDRPSDLGQMTLTMVATMAQIRRQHGVLLTRIVFADLDPSHLARRFLAPSAATVEDALDDACARYRFPRPAVAVSPAPSRDLPVAGVTA